MCPIENVIVSGADTDTSPYDSGSYASSTTYITGRAVEKACRKLQKLCAEAAKILNCESEETEFAGDSVKRLALVRRVSHAQIRYQFHVRKYQCPGSCGRQQLTGVPRLRLWQVW